MPSTETRPIESDADTGEDDGYAHYARKDEIAKAAVLGGTVTALCGHRFQPVRDPSRFPVCPRCKELAALLDDGPPRVPASSATRAVTTPPALPTRRRGLPVGWSRAVQ